MQLQYFLYFVLFVCLVIFSYFLVKLFIDLKKRKFLNNFIDSFSKREEERKIEENARYLIEGETSDTTLINKIDRVIQRSRLKIIFPFLTSEILIMFTLVISTTAAAVVFFIFHYLLFSLSAFVITLSIIIIVLQSKAKKTFNKIDDQLLHYNEILDNLSTANKDILSIFEKSISYSEEPLKSYSEQFVFEIKNGVPIEKAFKNYIDKVENNRFKMLLKNMYVASKYSANYHAILEESGDIIGDYNIIKRTKKLKVRSGRIGILIIVALGVFTTIILQGFTGDIYGKVFYTSGGHLFIVYFAIVFAITIYKFFTMEKFNY